MFFVKFICFFQKYVTVISQGGFTEMNFVAMDFETANHQPYSACSLALVMVKNSQIVDEFYTLIQPETPFFWRNVQIHGIHQEDVRNAPKFPEVWQTIQPYFQKNRLVVAHNAAFDTKVLAGCLDYYHLEQVDILFSAVKGKPVNEMLEQLMPITQNLYITEFDFPKAMTKEDISEEIDFGQKELVDDYASFIENYDGHALIITGSLYFISEVKAKVNF